ncbi:hypothetical protein J8629_14745 [Serratia fonticola]|uniref:hypothetical protein n=1 Tax=Serratia fonticola TaxID=47917 RepID=UPI001AE65BF1|nr:hypothetical protein [Serratia fonticola]MBP0998306.1 hypothetical protein [Serratia fonticola]
MSRTAEDTIKGFIYQFHKTAKQILEADSDSEIMVEGTIEDIDITNASGDIIAIQCKYHETKEIFTPSLIYKPILQMAINELENPLLNISYVLFIHTKDFQSQKTRELKLEEFDSALDSTQEKIKKLSEKIPAVFKKIDFVKKVKIEFAPSLDILSDELKKLLGIINITNSDVDTILYPNIINYVALCSTQKDKNLRKVKKSTVLDYLKKTNDTAITKWTLSLKNRNNLLKAKRLHLISTLKLNSRLRCFYFKKENLRDFEDEIVIFICNYLEKYHFKVAHIKTPIFVIECNHDELLGIQYRLHQKNVKANTGYIGNKFDGSWFFREPIFRSSKSKVSDREFQIRLLSESDSRQVINSKKNDDLFIVAERKPDYIDQQDVQIYLSGIETREELEYILSMRETHEK